MNYSLSSPKCVIFLFFFGFLRIWTSAENWFLKFSEVALYALDVYYNQTYLNRNDNRNDGSGGQFPTNQEQQYYDYYQQTFR